MSAAHPLAPESIAARVARWATDGLQGPLTLELYPTLACNLDCAFCDTTDRHRPPVDELSAARLLDLVDEAAAVGVRRVFLLGGGEPLLRKDVIGPLMAAVKRHRMEGILTTNGTLLGPALAQQLVDTGWDEVHVSIDGPTAAVHDRLRGVPGAFKRAVQATCRLAAWRRRAGVRFPRTALHFVLTRHNFTALSDMVRLAHAVGAHRVDFDALIAYKPEQRALDLSDAQRAQVPALAAAALTVAESLGVETTLTHFLSPDRIQRGTVTPPRALGEGLSGAPCLRAWHYIVAQADGRTSPCCVLAGEGGSVADRPLAEVWRDDPFLNDVRARMLTGTALPRCRECSWNILGHEAAIRDALPVGEALWPST